MTARPDNIPQTEWASMPESTRVMLRAMTAQMERAGVPVPELDHMGIVRLPPPAVSLGGRPAVITRQIAEIAASAGLYLMNDDLVLIDSRTGAKKEMSAKVFREWIDNHCVLYKKKKDDGTPIPTWIPKDMAESMLASPDFHSKIPKVSRINVVRLPVFRTPRKPGERPPIELLPEGYDAESETYTVKGLDYPEDMDLLEGFDWAKGLLQHFDWALTEKEQEKGTVGVFGRSFSVFWAAALTSFCETMFSPGVTKPMFFFNANEPGSGKTLLAQACLYPVVGFMGFVRWRKNEEELIKTLDANARWMRPALFLDDFKGHLKSEMLNQWLTEPMHEGRKIGTGDWFSVPRVGVTMMTGNGVTLEQDLARRSLMVDLFMTSTAREKVYPADAVHLSFSWFLKPENRRKWLGLLWAIVREYGQAEKPKNWRPLETFEDWSEVVVPMVRALGLPDPLEPYSPPDAGDQTGDEVAKLMTLAIEEFLTRADRKTASVSLTDLVSLSRRNGLFANVLGTLEESFKQMSARKGEAFRRVVDEDGDGTATRDPSEQEKWQQALAWTPPDNKMLTSFGMRFGKRATGKEPIIGGRRYQFGKRGSARKSLYELREVE